MKERLEIIADMVTPGSRVADIGTDHGFLPIRLVSSGKCPSALAMDIGKGPLNRAIQHIEEAGLTDKIECRISDGFDALGKGEAESAVIAGMGGDLIAEIILRKPDAVDELILSPHTHSEKVRAALRDIRFRITEEKMMDDEGKFYVFIKAERDGSVSDDNLPIYDYFGRYLIEKKDPILIRYLQRELEKFESIEQKNDYLILVRNTLSAMQQFPASH